MALGHTPRHTVSIHLLLNLVQDVFIWCYNILYEVFGDLNNIFIIYSTACNGLVVTYIFVMLGKHILHRP